MRLWAVLLLENKFGMMRPTGRSDMGYFIDGKWHIGNMPMDKGKFVRQPSVLRGQLTKSDVIDDPYRYDLYVSYACPWAHRTLIFRHLKGLEQYINTHVVMPYMGDRGWSFETPEPNLGARLLGEIYLSDPSYTGRVTVPVLWDKQEGKIINNESSEIIEMLNSCWNGLEGVSEKDYMPLDLKEKMDPLNDWIYENINNGVYRTGFAEKQEVYKEECEALFKALDTLEEMLNDRDYLVSDTLLATDIRLFVTLIRFDWVYVGHFKCNIRRIADYRNISRYISNIYRQVKATVNKDHIKNHYYQSHPWINPNQIVPLGPDIDYSE